MFDGEQSVRIRSALPREELEDIVAEALDRVGEVRYTDGSEFRVLTRRFDSSMATVEIDGELRKGRKEGEWRLMVRHQVKPTALCLIIAILGYLCLVFGPLILILPYNTQNDLKRRIGRAIRDARDDAEERGERTTGGG